MSNTAGSHTASTTAGHVATLEHRGPEIDKAHYPDYAEQKERIYPLGSWEVNWGSAVLLGGMATLGLPITAFGYHFENGSVSIGTAVAALVFCIIALVVGLSLVVLGFARHKRDDAH